jgi:hypothetical protein
MLYSVSLELFSRGLEQLQLQKAAPTAPKTITPQDIPAYVSATENELPARESAIVAKPMPMEPEKDIIANFIYCLRVRYFF